MSKEILISVEPEEKRVAILNNKQLEEYYIERPDTKTIAGNIYKGKVSAVIPGMEAAFINIGLKRNGFLYVSDILESPITYEDVEEKSEPASKTKTAAGARGILDLIKKNEEVLVQIVKEPIGTKGPRLTTNVSLAGRYVVLMPTQPNRGISRRIGDAKERDRLKGIAKEIVLPPGVGLILRTAASGEQKRHIAREVKYLLGLWRRLKAVSMKRSAPALIHEEYDLVLRTLRDHLTQDVERLIVDSREEYHRIMRFLRVIAPELRKRVGLYSEDEEIFKKKNVASQIDAIFQRRIDLKSGGYILIEPTESLVAIDVNSGSFVGRRRLEDTVFHVNMEAAKEIARQIRLRDLGGIIIIDFIDMEESSHRKQILKAFEDALEDDRAKANILSISEIGLLQLTRQRTRKSLTDMVYDECLGCSGRGIVKSVSTMCIEAMRALRIFLKKTPKPEVEISLHPDVASRFLNEDRVWISNLERERKVRISVKADAGMRMEDIRFK